jgi:hypothetical protein
MLRIFTAFPKAFLNFATDPRMKSIFKLGLVDIGHAKVQEKINQLCRSLFNNLEKQILDSFEKIDENIIRRLPSFIILEAGIKEWMPASVNDPCPLKLRNMFILLKNVLAESQIYQ